MILVGNGKPTEYHVNCVKRTGKLSSSFTFLTLTHVKVKLHMSMRNNERFRFSVFPILRNVYKTTIYNFSIRFIHLGAPRNNQENNGVSFHYLFVCNFIVFISFSFFWIMGKTFNLRTSALLCSVSSAHETVQQNCIALSERFVCSSFFSRCFVYSLPTSHKSVYDILHVISAMLEISVFSY